MSNKFEIPARLVRTLRIGLHTELGDAASDIHGVTGEPRINEHPAQYDEPLVRLDSTRALLDEIGWGDAPRPTDIEIDLTRHKCPLLRALRTQVLVLERAKLGKPGKAQATVARAVAVSELLAYLELALGDGKAEGPVADE